MESAKDRNITFRLEGTGCLNINDVNIFRLIEGLSGHEAGSPHSLIDRIRTAEVSIIDLKAQDLSHGTRLARLENR